jgi:hypothetical protein
MGCSSIAGHVGRERHLGDPTSTMGNVRSDSTNRSASLDGRMTGSMSATDGSTH